MHPPQHELDRIQKLHPWARLGWIGRKRTSPDDLNVGDFYLVQLISQRAAQFEYNEPWADKGPIYGKAYDPLQRVPFMMAGPFPAEDIYSGAVTAALELLLRPPQDRVYKSQRSKGEQMDDDVTQLAGEMGEYLWWKANQTDAMSNRATPAKDVTAEEKAVLTGERMRDLKNTFVTGQSGRK
jgi:hypothetical protein